MKHQRHLFCTLYACSSSPAASLFTRFRLRSTQMPRPYTTVDGAHWVSPASSVTHTLGVQIRASWLFLKALRSGAVSTIKRAMGTQFFQLFEYSLRFGLYLL